MLFFVVFLYAAICSFASLYLPSSIQQHILILASSRSYSSQSKYAVNLIDGIFLCCAAVVEGKKSPIDIPH